MQFLWALCFLLSPSIALAVPPGDDWFTLRSKNFHVHHTTKQNAYAHAFVASLERAFPLLTKDLGWTPATPIDIVLSDESDSSNGYASSVPFNKIELYAVPFPSESSLLDYHNWVEELAIHELTHIIANDTSFGLYQTLRSIFGSIIKPNGMQPSWLVEGLAVYEETALSRGGRGRSFLTEALLRTATKHDLLDSSDYINLGRFNDGVYWWPAGNTPYLLGYSIQATAQSESAAVVGQSIPGRISANNAKILPYRMNGNAENIAGKDWNQIWAASIGTLKERYESEATDDTLCYLSDGGRFTGGHALSSDGWLYFILEHRDEGSALARVKANAPCGKSEPEILAERRYGGPNHISVSPNGRYVAYSEMHVVGNFRQYADLRLWDVKNKSIVDLSHGLRAFDPAFTDDGLELIVIQNLGDNRQALAKMSAKLSGEDIPKTENIFVGNIFERLATPFVRGGVVYFSKHNNQGQEEIFKISLSGGSPSPAIPGDKKFRKGERFSETAPYLSESGDLYFSAYYGTKDASHSLDLYVLKSGRVVPERIVQTSSGLSLRPRVDTKSNSLYFTNYGLDGFNIVRADLSAPLPNAALKPEAQSLHQALTKAPHEGKAPIESTPLVDTSGMTSEPYSVFSSPASSLWPKYWAPQFEFVTDGYLVGATTSGNDPLDRHLYALSGVYDSRANFPLFNANYQNWSYSVGLSLQAEQKNSYFQGSKFSNRNTIYSAALVFPHNPFTLQIGAGYQQKYYFLTVNKSPFAYMDMKYSTIRKTPSAIAANRGVTLHSYLAGYPETNFDRQFLDWRPDINLYSQGLFASHSMALKASAGITTNQSLASNYYLGGGVTTVSSNDFIVRGYPSDVLLGQRIAAANFSYTIPLGRPHQGLGVFPFFLQDYGFRLLADGGTANYIAIYNREVFRGYRRQDLGDKILYGVGAELISHNTVLYYIPFDITLGVHRGMKKEHGGDTFFYLGLNTDIPDVFGAFRSSGPTHVH